MPPKGNYPQYWAAFYHLWSLIGISHNAASDKSIGGQKLWTD